MQQEVSLTKPAKQQTTGRRQPSAEKRGGDREPSPTGGKALSRRVPGPAKNFAADARALVNRVFSTGRGRVLELTASSPDDHLSAVVIELAAAGELQADGKSAVEEHLRTCSTCEDHVRELKRRLAS